jgi:hypothetical protein
MDRPSSSTGILSFPTGITGMATEFVSRLPMTSRRVA